MTAALAGALALGVLAPGSGARAQDTAAGAQSNPDADPNAPAPTARARIEMALRKGDRETALQVADAFLAENPRDAQVRFLKAVVLGDLNRTGEAATLLEGLTQDFPELAEPYNNLAVLRAGQGELASAERYLQQAIRAQPNYVTAHENLGDLYIAMAAAQYQEAAKLGPERPALRKKLALARELGGKLHSTR